MRRLARWTLNAMTVLSLLACIAACGLWVSCRRSGHRTAFGRGTSAEITLVAHRSGVFALRTVRLPPSLANRSARQRYLTQHTYDAFRFAGILANAGPVYDRSSDPSDGLDGWVGIGRSLIVPFGWLVAATGAMPAVRLLNVLTVRWRHRASQQSHCLACSYDLTGNVSGVCPECGTTVAKGNA
jgi:hypothetical protein